MVQNNKVLTVSYGTFSCTLEGFDDSFETMKAIAEYFRDLAADDRYFGSEPPQPDTEMLTRIAQRDVSRRVEASRNEAGLLIRSTEQAAAQSHPTTSAPKPNVIDTPPAPPSAQAFFAEAESVEDAAAPAADSIAAKLQRIRAVVSHSDENSVIYTEDEDTSLMKSAGPSDAVAAAFAAGTLDPADLDDATAEPSPLVEAPNVTEEPVEPETEFTAEVEETELSELENEPEALATDSSEVTDEEQPEDESTLTGAWFTDFDEDEEDANILSDAEPDNDVVAESEDNVLTEDDEVDLLEEIASVETILANRAAKADAEKLDMDQDVSRLMDKASERLNDPSTSDQREAYTHLRAAVAATEAERHVAAVTQEDNNEGDYREDMSSVVSPRRPETEVTTARPSSDANAPLKLVAEQRIDNRATEDTGPISPRRVKTSSADGSTEEGGFALFAQEQGAQSLPDLLEAAASYLSFIEGQEQFSRPQLMNKVRSLKQDDFNREESLRSFGQLLRDGKIEKAGGGRFSASTQIGFRPDDERAAG
ncbi:hypothetical protein [Ruegeria atlantica]|uniref:hypothetical protein n=1 Tax=Ruegeria atlantica TaxID=81569 RepID=UPI00147CDB3D|nr:hypothetical protein [Ruegeria atlantica]